MSFLEPELPLWPQEPGPRPVWAAGVPPGAGAGLGAAAISQPGREL